MNSLLLKARVKVEVGVKVRVVIQEVVGVVEQVEVLLPLVKTPANSFLLGKKVCSEGYNKFIDRPYWLIDWIFEDK